MKWIVCIILQSLKIGLSEETVIKVRPVVVLGAPTSSRSVLHLGEACSGGALRILGRTQQ
jgi:hypothetical protein